jgi:hypothetical protein
MEKIRWTNRVKNEEVVQRVRGQEHAANNKKEGRLSGLVTSGVGTAFYNTL